MSQCPSCQKFAPLSEPEIEDPDVTDNGDGSGTVNIRMVRTSECCGDEMKEYNFELEYDASDALAQHYEEEHDGEEIEEPDVEADFDTTDRRQTTAMKRGKKRKDGTYPPAKEVPIGYRYQRQFYGVKGTVTVRCSKCQELVEQVELDDEAQASSFDELN